MKDNGGYPSVILSKQNFEPFMHRYILIVITLFSCYRATAQNDSLLMPMIEENRAVNHYFLQVRDNPALKNRERHPYTQIGLCTAQRQQNQNLLSYQGKNRQEYAFKANSVSRLNNMVMWGGATYANVTTENKTWCDVADPERLYPYFLADTVGGKYYEENYDVQGGVNVKRDKSFYGVEIDYKAKQHHGKTDPRPYNKVYDLGATLAFAHAIKTCSKLGAAINLKTYRQFIEVRTFKENRKDYFYYLKGFGQQHNKLLDINSSAQIKYYGHTIGGSLAWYRNTANRSYCRLSFGHNKTKQIHDNEYIPFLLKDYLLNATLVEELHVGQKHVLISIAQDYYKKIGTEVLFERVLVNESTSTYEWQMLSSANRFKSVQTNSQFNVVLETNKNRRVQHELGLRENFQRVDENYYEPNLWVKYNALFSGLEHAIKWRAKKAYMGVSYGLQYKYVLTKETRLNSSTTIETVFAEDVANRVHDAGNVHVSLWVDKPLKTSVLFIKTLAAYTKVNHVEVWNFSISTGITI